MNTLNMVTETMAVQDLRTYYQNPRIGNVRAIEESLATNGQYRAIVVNRGTQTGRPNEVLAGNHTLKAARNLGWHDLLCHLIDVPDDEAARIVLADNRTNELGEIDLDTVLALTTDLGTFEGTGYTEEALNELLGIDEEEIPELDDDPELDEEEPPKILIVVANANTPEEQKEIYATLKAAGYDNLEMREVNA